MGRPYSDNEVRLLDWLRRRSDGESVDAIAKDYGVHRTSVGVQTNKVKNADILESGEDCVGFYW